MQSFLFFFCKFRRRGLYRGFSSSLVSLFIVLFFFLVAAGANTLKFQSGTRGGRGLAAAAPVMISLASYRKIVFFFFQILASLTMLKTSK